jgi:hypothetical protein
MKRLFACTLALFALAAGLPAQEKPRVQVDLKRVTPGEQGTPDFAAGNVTMKRWRPKKWFELDMEFDIKVPQDAGGRNGSYAGLSVNVYIVFQAKTKDGKYEAAKATLDLGSVPAGETCHALAYISPADLRAILQKDNFTATDISGWGVEFMADGQRLAVDGSPKNPWWEKAENFQFRDGVVKAKAETPFAILFGDYDVQAKSK